MYGLQCDDFTQNEPNQALTYAYKMKLSNTDIVIT